MQNEKVAEVVQQMAKEVKVTLDNEEIIECYRAKEINGRERPITLTTKSPIVRDRLIKAVKKNRMRLGQIKMQPENKKIYINEALIPKKKMLLYKTKNAAKDKQWKVWTFKGEVYIKRSASEVEIKVKNEEELVLITQ